MKKLNGKFQEVTEEQLEQVNGGAKEPDAGLNPVKPKEEAR